MMIIVKVVGNLAFMLAFGFRIRKNKTASLADV